jgi:hypothetical protein
MYRSLEKTRFFRLITKALIIITFLLLTLDNVFADTNWKVFTTDNPLFNMLGDFQYNIQTNEIKQLAKKHHKTDLDFNSSVAVNTFGYRLYEQA